VMRSPSGQSAAGRWRAAEGYHRPAGQAPRAGPGARPVAEAARAGMEPTGSGWPRAWPAMGRGLGQRLRCCRRRARGGRTKVRGLPDTGASHLHARHRSGSDPRPSFLVDTPRTRARRRRHGGGTKVYGRLSGLLTRGTSRLSTARAPRVSSVPPGGARGAGPGARRPIPPALVVQRCLGCRIAFWASTEVCALISVIRRALAPCHRLPTGALLLKCGSGWSGGPVPGRGAHGRKTDGWSCHHVLAVAWAPPGLPGTRCVCPLFGRASTHRGAGRAESPRPCAPPGRDRRRCGGWWPPDAPADTGAPPRGW